MKPKVTSPFPGINLLDYPSPFFLLNPGLVVERYKYCQSLFKKIGIFYALKSNPHPEILRVLNQTGSGFEAASMHEIELLYENGVKPTSIIFGTAVKSADHIGRAFNSGIDRFAADSLPEIEKVAQMAPGAKIYVRAAVDDSGSVFVMSEKFGAPVNEVVSLLIRARQLGLHPYGISFHVGSQAGNAMAWSNAIKSLVPVIQLLEDHGVKLEVLDLGGGYPWQYQPDRGIPELEEIAASVHKEATQLPYKLKLMMEPGRGLVAGSSLLVTTVISKVWRNGRLWLYLDAGTYNALFEAMAHQGSTPYEVTLEDQIESEPTEEVVLAGPTGDGIDLISRNAVVPRRTGVGHRLVIHDVGAYTMHMATPFNGFPVPPVYVLPAPARKKLRRSTFKH